MSWTLLVLLKPLYVRIEVPDPSQKLDGKDGSIGLNDTQRHHWVNFPCRVAGKMASPVCFLFIAAFPLWGASDAVSTHNYP